MRRVAACLVLLALLGPLPGETDEPDASPVVLELFTSQGCSSCPPADRLLSALASSPELAGRVVPLAFHVDYWNYIGWTDPFSAAEWSARQREYARQLGTDRIYTPELVIDGRTDVVGSDRRRVMEEIERALAAPRPASVRLTDVAGEHGTWEIALDARLDATAPAGPHRVLVAITESGLETPVARGENGGRTLRNDHAVRLLTEAGELHGPGAVLTTPVRLPLEGSWIRERVRAVAFVQDPRTGRVLGAAPPLAAARR